ncbi:MAG: glycosyl transferase, partial [Candidatus Binatia bacterium]
MIRLLCYISGHGFGHAVRVMEVVRALRRRRPDVAVAIRTPVPRWFFELGDGAPCSYASSRLDVGAVQSDSLSVDPEASLRAYAEIVAHREQLLRAEVAAVEALRPTLIFADIP